MRALQFGRGRGSHPCSTQAQVRSRTRATAAEQRAYLFRLGCFFRLALALDVRAMSLFVALDILKATVLVANRIKLCTGRTSMRRSLGHADVLPFKDL